MNVKLKRYKKVYEDFPCSLLIYFLLKKSNNKKLDIVYMGISRNVYTRIRQHKKDKDFDYYRLIKSKYYSDNYNYMEYREQQLIAKFKPKYNVQSKERKSVSPYRLETTHPFWSYKYKTFLRFTYNRIFCKNRQYKVHNIEYLIPSENTKLYVEKTLKKSREPIQNCRPQRKIWEKNKVMRRLENPYIRLRKSDIEKEFKDGEWSMIKGFKKYDVRESITCRRLSDNFYRERYKYKTNGRTVLL
jgi:predicted GIY-YIG superfamily endonuclease